MLKLLRDNAEIVSARAGRPIAVTAVSARDRSKDRGVPLGGLRWYDDPVALVGDAAVDVVVELIGGADGPARALVEAAIAAGKPVVTANKAMLAIAWRGAGRRRGGKGRAAGVRGGGGGRHPGDQGAARGAGRQPDQPDRRHPERHLQLHPDPDARARAGVRRRAGRRAEALGYAEADPAFDIDGIDAAHKLAILAALAFGRPVAFDAVHVEGIRGISALDIGFARELGYRIKLLGLARQTEAGIEAAGASLHGAGDSADRAGGRGVQRGGDRGRFRRPRNAGGPWRRGGPTASAVVADLVDLARGRTTPIWGGALSDAPSVPISAHVGPYYLCG